LGSRPNFVGGLLDERLLGAQRVDVDLSGQQDRQPAVAAPTSPAKRGLGKGGGRSGLHARRSV
jgi:hypothetical protein